MKKLILGVFVLFTLTIAFMMPGNSMRVKAADKLIEKYFPKGIEKVKPYKPIINIDENDTHWISAIVKQSDDVLKLVRDFEACTEEVEYNDGYYSKFYVDYGIDALETTVQFDISVDGGDWQYNKSWDKKEQDGYADAVGGDE